jgi:hypothetical protein
MQTKRDSLECGLQANLLLDVTRGEGGGEGLFGRVEAIDVT